MNQSADRQIFAARGFWIAFSVNFVWINISEVWRYLYVIRPMLLEEKATQSGIAPFDLLTFAIWGVWDTILILSSTTVFWLWFSLRGTRATEVIAVATGYTITIFGMIWIGIANMGLASFQFLWVATPLAWIEMTVAAGITAAIFRLRAPQ